MECYGVYAFLDSTFSVAASIVFGISAVITAFWNTFCLAVLWQHSQRSKSNKILTSLALSDCLVGCISFPLGSWLVGNGYEMNKQRCIVEKIFITNNLWMVGSSICSLTFVAYDRYLHITKSTTYDDILSDRKVILLIAFYWTVTGLLAIGSAFNSPMYNTIAAVYVLVALVWMSVSYYHIWKAVRQSQTRIAANVVGNRGELRKDIRLAKKVSILITLYIVTLIPLMILLLFKMFHGVKLFYLSEFKGYFILITGYCALFNSCLNPFVIIWKDPDFRRACKKILRRNKLTSALFLKTNVVSPSPNA